MSYLKLIGEVWNASSIDDVIKATVTKYEIVNKDNVILEQNIKRIDESREKCLDRIESLHSKFDDELDNLSNLMEKIEAESYNFHDMSSIRPPSEISDELGDLVEQLWYHRHLDRKERIKNGEETCDPVIWSTAVKNAKKIKRRLELEYGNDFLCKNEFEWGMLNGEVSALRWILGDEWGDLDS